MDGFNLTISNIINLSIVYSAGNYEFNLQICSIKANQLRIHSNFGRKLMHLPGNRLNSFSILVKLILSTRITIIYLWISIILSD